MSKFEEARKTINEIDDQLVLLFKKRMEQAKEIGLYKYENNLAISDIKREEEIINKCLLKLNDKSLEKYFISFYKSLLDNSKYYQNDIINNLITTKFNKKELKFGLIGKDLSYSLSKTVHESLFKMIDFNATYDLIEIKEEMLESIINKLRTNEYQGFNVTIPYKEKIMQYLDKIDSDALKIGSVNTIVLEEGKVVGYNTDYLGFSLMCQYHNVEVNNKECYVLGTGGSSKTVAKALKDLGGNVYLVSRTKKENVLTYDQLSNKDIDIIVNTTPVGTFPNVDESVLDNLDIKTPKFAIDLVYNPLKTKFMKTASNAISGIFMLVLQAKSAQEIWLNRKINVDVLPVVENCIERINEKYIK